METNGIVTSQNDLSDKKVIRNVRDADLDELQTIFDRATPKRYDRVGKGLGGTLSFPRGSGACALEDKSVV